MFSPETVHLSELVPNRACGTATGTARLTNTTNSAWSQMAYRTTGKLSVSGCSNLAPGESCELSLSMDGCQSQVLVGYLQLTVRGVSTGPRVMVTASFP